MGRPKGKSNRRRVIKPVLGAVGVFVPSFTQLMDNIAEAVHEDAKISGVMIHEDNELTYAVTLSDVDHVVEHDGVPAMYTDVVAVLEEVIKRYKGIA